MFRKIILSSVIAAMLLLSFTNIHTYAQKDCKMPGTAHDDNSPSTSKGWKMIKAGASVCELAKACDAMEIDVKIKDKDQLHTLVFYNHAPSDVKKELDEYAEHGRGHDSPNIVCYEIEQSVNE